MINLLLICIVFNNITLDQNLASDWGYSAWLQTENESILFDTGSDGYLLLSNMQKMNLDPGEIDVIVISHIHTDHTGGLKKLLTRTKDDIKIYVPDDTYDRIKHQYPDKDIIAVKKSKKIAKGVYSTGQYKSREGIAEQALMLNTPKGLVVIAACSHPGIDRLVSAAKKIESKRPIYLVTGGFHMRSYNDNEFDRIVNELRRMVVKNIGPTHCTGDEMIDRLKDQWGDGFWEMHLGTCVEIK